MGRGWGERAGERGGEGVEKVDDDGEGIDSPAERCGSSGFEGVVVGSCREVIGLGWESNVRRDRERGLPCGRGGEWGGRRGGRKGVCFFYLKTWPCIRVALERRIASKGVS